MSQRQPMSAVDASAKLGYHGCPAHISQEIVQEAQAKSLDLSSIMLIIQAVIKAAPTLLAQGTALWQAVLDAIKAH